MPSDVAYRPPALVSVSGAVVAYVHTALGFFAFGSALVVALSLHYHKVVKNGIAGWPLEYWPSVSATIGDWYPERNLFQIGIALMSGPRFLLVFLSSLLVSLSKPSSPHAAILLVVGSIRTIACGGWVFVTSSDDHDVHDIFMGLYLILTPPWMYITSGSLAAQPNKETLMATTSRNLLANKARRMRRFAAAAFFGMTPFMVLFFYRHKVLEIPGAYTYYAFFEWGLIVFDLLFDCASTYDLSRLEIHIVEAKNPAADSDAKGQAASLLGGDWVRGGTHAAVSSGAWSTGPQPASSRMQTGEKSSAALKGHHDALAVPFLPDLLSYSAESYLAFCFWSTLTALHPSIFFFSVYNMGVGGHEALLVIQVLALALALHPFARRMLIPSTQGKLLKGSSAPPAQVGPIRRPVLAVLYALCLSGLSVWMINDRLVRLLATAASCIGFALLYTLEWGRAWESNELDRAASTWLVGLLLSSLAKYTNHSNNPAWPLLNSTNGGANLVAFLLALGAVAVRMLSHRKYVPAQSTPTVARPRVSSSSAAIAASSLGALLFILHILLTDSGTMLAWTWTGYPIQGPMAVSHGYSIILTSSLSLYFSLHFPSLSLHPGFWAFGLTSMAVLLECENWVGYAGALGLAAFLPPLARPILQVALKGDPIKMLLGAWLVADLLAFLQVLTVAYAFIPGGMVMREKTNIMMAATMGLLIAGLLLARRDSLQLHKWQPVSSRLKVLAAVPLLLVSIVALCIPSARHVGQHAIVPYHAQDRVVTAGIWTVHFSLDQGMWDSTRRMSDLIKDMQLDIVGLLETDLHRTVFGNRDLTQYLGESLGMYADIGPGPDKHTWGAVLLSKFPIVNSTHHLLPSPHGELAPAIHAVLDIYGVHTHVIVSHNGQEEDPLDRELQTTKLAEIARNAYPHPAIFLGYVVTKPHAPRPNPYEILFTDGKLFDVDATDLNRWCQYIGFRGLERLAYVRVSRYTVTDTELQTAKFRIPRPGETVDPTRDVLPSRIRTVPQEAWAYPTKFIDPPAMVYNKHKYSPHFYPLYYGPSQPQEGTT